MSIIMSCLMSCVITLANVGLVNNFLALWMDAWAFGFVIAFAAVYAVSPLVHKLTELVLEEQSE